MAAPSTIFAAALAVPLTHYRYRPSPNAPKTHLDRVGQLRELQRLMSVQQHEHEPFALRRDANWLLGALSAIAARTSPCGGHPVLGRLGRNATRDGGWWVCATPRLVARRGPP